MTRRVVAHAIENAREAGRVTHKLENELAAIRIQIELVLTLMNNGEGTDEQILHATDESVNEVRKLSRWIHETESGATHQIQQ
jgi:transcription initiation factor IIE alpha subunit